MRIDKSTRRPRWAVPRTPRASHLAGAVAVALLAVLSSAHLLAERTHDSSPVSKLDLALRGRLDKRQSDDVRVIVQTNGDREDVKRRLKARGNRIEADHALIRAFTATVHHTELATLANDPSVGRVSIDALVTAHQSTSSALLATEALPYSGITGATARVAVIDSGLEVTADLGTKRIIGFFDFTRGGVFATPYDDYGHGTHVAGLIAGDGYRSNGAYAGIAPAAKVLVLKVLDRTGSGYTSHVIQALEFIVATQKTFGIHVINLSLGHPIFEPAETDPLVQAVQKATQAGISVVVAAGNYGQNPTTGLPGYGGITSPGNAPSAITAGVVDIMNTAGRGDDTIPVYSSRGPSWYDGYAKPDVVAPGHRLVSIAALQSTIYQQYPELRVVGKTGDIARYIRLSGTSMAAAVTTGSLALMLDAVGTNKKYFTPNLLKAIVEWSAIPVPAHDALTQGRGAINIAGAVTFARKINPTLPVGSYWLTSNLPPSTTIANASWTWAQTVVWGNTVGSGGLVNTNQRAWGQTFAWDDTVVWGNTVEWGTNVVWTNATMWSDTVVWGTALIGTMNGDTVVWGNINVTPDTVVWGNLATVTRLSSVNVSSELWR